MSYTHPYSETEVFNLGNGRYYLETHKPNQPHYHLKDYANSLGLNFNERSFDLPDDFELDEDDLYYNGNHDDIDNDEEDDNDHDHDHYHNMIHSHNCPLSPRYHNYNHDNGASVHNPNLLVIPGAAGALAAAAGGLGAGHYFGDGHKHFPANFDNGGAMSSRQLKFYEKLTPKQRLIYQRLNPVQRDIFEKRLKSNTWVQTITTGGLAGVGAAMAGVPGAAIGGGAGSLLGDLISPTAGQKWGGRNVGKALWGAFGGAVGPAILPMMAVPAAIVGGGIAGYANAWK
jgi:hypothetical protein